MKTFIEFLRKHYDKDIVIAVISSATTLLIHFC